MAVSILVLHKAANFFGCKIKYKSLLLCAAMAFLVNFAALNISSFLTPMHYWLILIFVLATSLLVTFYNAYLLHRERRLAAAMAAIHGEEAPPGEAGEAPPAADTKETSAKETLEAEKEEEDAAPPEEIPEDAEQEAAQSALPTEEADFTPDGLAEETTKRRFPPPNPKKLTGKRPMQRSAKIPTMRRPRPSCRKSPPSSRASPSPTR